MTPLSRRQLLTSGALAALGVSLASLVRHQAWAGPNRVRSNDPLLQLSLQQSAARIRSGRLSALELAEAVITAADRLNTLNAYTTFDPDFLRRQARAADARLKKSGPAGPLHGVPLILKDNVNTAALPTSGGTPGLRGNDPGVDAQVAARLFAAGALLAGKANLHELSTGGTSHNLTFGAVGNPFDPQRVPGGSSGGTAAAVGARMIAGGLGSDTGGSVRVPAALCGVVGMRPSSGRYPSTGIVPLSSSLDTAGPIARRVADVALLDAILAGDDAELIEPKLSTLRLGVPGDELLADTDPHIIAAHDTALALLRDRGVTLIPVDLTEIRKATPKIIGGLIGLEFHAAMTEYLAAYAPDLTVDELAAQIADTSIRGMLAKPTDPAASQHKRRQILTTIRPALIERHRQLFRQHALDALIFPTTPEIALPAFDVNRVVKNGKPRPSFLYFTHTSLASAAGTPSLTVPAGLTRDGLPTGLCLDGLPGADRKILGIGQAVAGALSAAGQPVAQTQN